MRDADNILAARDLDWSASPVSLAQFGDFDMIVLRPRAHRFLAARQRPSDRLLPQALLGERVELGDLFGLPGLAVPFELLFHISPFRPARGPHSAAMRETPPDRNWRIGPGAHLPG